MSTFPAVSAPCLGQGEYTVVVRTRPTPKYPASVVIGNLEPRSLNWSRSLNGTSSADLTIGVTGADEGAACCEVVRAIRPGRTNIEYHRDGELVWTGLIVTKSFDPDTQEVTLSANDLSIWLQWRLFTHTLKPRKIDLADIFVGYLKYALRGELPVWSSVAKDDPPIYVDDPGLTFEAIPTGILGDRTIDHHDLRVAATELDELANTGCDWTVTNTKMWIGASELVTADAPPVPLRLRTHITDEFFTGSPRTRETAEGMVTDAWLRGNTVQAHVGGPASDGLLIQRVLDAYSIEDASSAQAAAKSYHDLSANPLTFVEGDNDLASSAPIDVQTLIPGTRAQVALTGGGCVPYTGTLRVETVNTNLSAEDGEQVRLTLQPLGTSFDARGTG